MLCITKQCAAQDTIRRPLFIWSHHIIDLKMNNILEHSQKIDIPIPLPTPH